MWHALPLATPWDYGSNVIITEPLHYHTFTHTCRACMGLNQNDVWPVSPAIQAKARLNDALADRPARINKQRVWTFPKLVDWYTAHATVYDGRSTYLFWRSSAPVELTIRHIRVFTELPIKTSVIWRNPNWTNEYTWSIVE